MLFNEIINQKFSKYTHFYTDGSVKGNTAGFGIFSKHARYKKRMPNCSTIYTTELKAIHDCIKIITKTDIQEKDFLIISDSMSSLTSINSIYSKNPIISKINDLIMENKKNGKNINFLWCPSHVNISGNEEADRLAKESLSIQKQCANQKNLSHDYKTHIKKFVFEKWSNEWNLLTNNKLRDILREPNKTFIAFGKNRKEIAKIVRVRIGHTKLTHSYIFEKSPPPCATVVAY